MNKHIKRLTALISASFANQINANVIPNMDSEPTVSDDNKLSISVLNPSVSRHLATHRSHKSHSSHRSHRSSSSGGGSSYSVPSTSPSTSGQSSSSSSSTSDPLGQQPRSDSSYPSNSTTDISEKLKNDELRKNIIMRMQLTLQFQKLYDGNIDGIMGEKTRTAVLKYKKLKGIPGDTVLDAETLNSLGILGY